MKTVILCGGKGTQLREEIEYHPKPMVPIGNRPVLRPIMKINAHHGFTDFLLCLGYKGEMIKDYLYDFAHGWWKTWKARGRLFPGAVSYRANEIMRYAPEIPGERQP